MRLAALVAALLLTAPAQATGLAAVAVSSDGKRIAVGGQNRVVYLLDAASLEVTRRVWLGARIRSLAFSKDGARLVAGDETDRLDLLDVATGKRLGGRANVRGLAVSPVANLGAVDDRAEPTRPRLKLLDLNTLEEKGRVDLPAPVAAFAFTADGKSLVALGASEPAEERRVPLDRIPRELKGLARATFRLQHDGHAARRWLFEVPSGKMLRRHVLWYTSDSDSTLLVQVGAATYVLNRANLCARIAGDGTTTLFETPRRINHALGVSTDGKVLLSGGLGEGTRGELGADKHTVFTLEPLPGQSEYFSQFTVNADGSAWGVTTAFRVVRIGSSGKVEKVAAVY